MAFTTIYLPLSTILSECFRQKEAYSELRQKSKIELFVKIAHVFRWLTISVKIPILDAGLGSEYILADSNPLLVFSKNEAADLFAN